MTQNLKGVAVSVCFVCASFSPKNVIHECSFTMSTTGKTFFTLLDNHSIVREVPVETLLHSLTL